MKKPPIPALVVAGAVITGLYFLLSDGDDASQRKTPPVDVLPVYEETIYDSVESLGTAMANESIAVTANVAETIRDIHFEDGQIVEKGDLIATLSQQEEQAQLAAAQARQRENSRELKRLQTLLKNKAAAQREYDERLTQIEVTKQEIEEIDARIADRTMRAPFTGVTGIRNVSVGALVQPGDVITTLDDISQIKLDFTVPSIYLDSLQVGVPIEALRDGIDSTTFSGSIYSINNRIDPVTRSVLVRAIVPNDDGLLKPGLLMRVTLLRNERKALIVPEESIIQRNDDHYVLVVPEGGGFVEEREVQTGMRRPGIVEVTEGLSVGEHIITRGVNMVSDGQDVTIGTVWDEIRKPITETASPAAQEAE
jgi:membrane fusion protein, multidrug efflux system